MPQAAVQNFASLTALRILSGAAEAIADPGKPLSPMGKTLPVADTHSFHAVHEYVLHSSRTAFENIVLVRFQRSWCRWRWSDR